jgi:sulfite reductase alpha subunit
VQLSIRTEEKDMAKTETPLLDDLEKGKWPSFVKDMKQAAQKKRSEEHTSELQSLS